MKRRWAAAVSALALCCLALFFIGAAEEPPVGKLQAAGYVKVTPNAAAWDVYGRTSLQSQVEKGLIVIDTTTGKVLASRVYSTETVKVESGAKTTP